MADVAVPSSSPIPAKKSKKPSKKALKPKAASKNDANILAQELTESSPAVPPPPPTETSDPMKENHPSLSSAKKGKGKAAKGAKQTSFDKELEEMQEMLQQLKLEKEKTEEMLKEKDEILKAREEELESKGKQQEKMQAELKKLHKLKEFRPNLNFQILKDNEQPDEKSKKKKGGSEPKKPTPAYGLWCKDQWNEVKKENPDADFKQMSIILGAKWKTVSAEEKKPYEEKYQIEKEAYLQVAAMGKRETEAMQLLEEEQKQKTAMELLQQYLQFIHDAADDQGSKKTKKEKDPLKPKQPMSAFFIFSNERRAALLADKKNVTEAAKIAGEEWKNMTDKQKSPYVKAAKKNKDSYLIEMEAYKVKKEEESMSLMKEEEENLKLQKLEAMQLLKKKEKTDQIIKKTKEEEKKNKKKKQNTDPNKPKKPATSYLLFCKEARKTITQERPGVNSKTVTALISLKWKELSEEERRIWDAKAAELMDVYKKEIEEYNKSCAAAGASDENEEE
ncbi:High mobility group B protein 13 [Linum grandiflorum]